MNHIDKKALKSRFHEARANVDQCVAKINAFERDYQAQRNTLIDEINTARAALHEAERDYANAKGKNVRGGHHIFTFPL